MSLEEFDALIDRMRSAYEYAESLGQYMDAAKVLYRMNEELPDDLQLDLEELEDPESAKPFLAKHDAGIRSAIAEYRQMLMEF